MRTLLAALLTFSAGAAMAQETPTTPDAATSDEATEATEPSVDERITTTEEQLSSIAEQLIEVKNALSPLTKLRFSGYVQSRYQWEATRENDIGGFSRFTVRRGRLMATYTDDVAQFMLQIDAVPTGVTLRDAEATLFIPGTKQSMSLTLGQMRWPFGYEVLQSSREREFPERTRVVRAFLPEERDRGLRYSAQVGVLRLSAGVFDGSGMFYPGFVGQDNDKEKDFIGRAGFDLKLISGGVSGWYGHTLGIGAGDTFRRAYERSRLGADLQVYLDLLPLGTTALKGEYIWGKTYVNGGRENLGRVASGWYALLVQNIGLTHTVAVRYDYFDPAHGTRALGTGTLGLAATHHFGEHLKLTAAYELPLTRTVPGAVDPPDNLFTLQLQAHF